MAAVVNDKSIPVGAGGVRNLLLVARRVLDGELNSHLPNLASRKSDPLSHFRFWGGGGRGVVSL